MGRPLEVAPRDRAQLKELKNHHRGMARDMVALGLRNGELAKMYGMTPGQITLIVNSPLFIAEQARLEAGVEDSVMDLKEDLRLLGSKAKAVLTEELHMEAEDVPGRRLRVQVAQDLLDRLGVRKVGAEGAGGFHLHRHQEVHIHGMSDAELRRDVFDMIEEE